MILAPLAFGIVVILGLAGCRQRVDLAPADLVGSWQHNSTLKSDITFNSNGTYVSSCSRGKVKVKSLNALASAPWMLAAIPTSGTYSVSADEVDFEGIGTTLGLMMTVRAITDTNFFCRMGSEKRVLMFVKQQD